MVAGILRQVRTEGDEAVVRYTAELDGVDVSDGLRVPPEEIEKARADADPDLWRALEVAFGRILAYHAHEGAPPGDLVEGGIIVGHLTRAVERAGIYAPGGRARYPSTVLMCAAPARVAGVGSIALCVPPAADGRIDTATLCAASIAGVDEVYRIGGAQAIAAMAYGTRSVPAVDVIAGPGQRVRGRGQAPAVGRGGGGVGLRRALGDRGGRRPGRAGAVRRRRPRRAGRARARRAGLAGHAGTRRGPRRSRPRWTAWWPRSSRRADLEATLATAGIVCLVDGPEQALAVANAIAPEHLQLMVPEDEGLALLGPGPERRRRLHRTVVAGQHGRLHRRAQPRPADQPHGALRLGAAGGRLPQARARGAGHAGALRTLGPHVVTLAETEGLPAHADSVRRRLDALDARSTSAGTPSAP